MAAVEELWLVRHLGDSCQLLIIVSGEWAVFWLLWNKEVLKLALGHRDCIPVQVCI